MITGGGGFIGTNLAKALSEKGIKKQQIVLADREFKFLSLSKQLGTVAFCDLSKSSDTVALFENRKFSHVFHLAANSDIQKSSSDPSVEVRDTFQTTLNVIEEIRRAANNEIHLIFSSSSAIYGNQANEIRITTKPHPISPYGWMKLASEIAIRAIPPELCSKKSIFRFPNVVGQYATHGVVFDLVVKQLGPENTLDVLGNGNQTKPYIYAGQLVDILSELCISGDNGGLLEVNISPEDRISVREIAEKVAGAFENTKPIIFGDTEFGWIGDVPSYSFNTSELKRVYKKPILSSRQAIELAIQDQKSSYGR